jgi:hypothetical protein
MATKSIYGSSHIRGGGACTWREWRRGGIRKLSRVVNL